VMTAKIGGVEVMAVVYAWSQKRTCFIVSRCGKTVAHDKPYVSKFENEFGADLLLLTCCWSFYP
jgi:hypothetical protein